jgi:hypothetical protein
MLTVKEMSDALKRRMADFAICHARMDNGITMQQDVVIPS